MAIEAPTNRADLEEWLARLAGLLQALRLSDQRRNELLSSYRTFKPQITGSRELSKNETYLFIIAAAGIVNLLFYFIFKVMEPGDMVVVAGVTFFVFYKIVQRMWRARGKSTDKEPRFSIGKRVFYIRQLLEALIPTNIIIMIFLLCTYPPIPVLVVTGISIALGIVIGLVSASLAARVSNGLCKCLI